MEKIQILKFDILKTFHQYATLEEMCIKWIALIKEYLDCEAVALRLKQSDDYPFFVNSGFPDKFIKSENYLCTNYDNNSSEHTALACLCGNIINKSIDLNKDFFTEEGSFWSNCMTEFFISADKTSRGINPRDECIKFGYESMALIPVKVNNKNIGLLHVTDKRRDLFTLEMINSLEELGYIIGMAVKENQAENEVRKNEKKLKENFKILRERKSVLGIIHAISLTIQVKDPYTAIHQWRVSDLAGVIAKEMKLNKDQSDSVIMSGSIHDLGKLSIPSEILSKPGKITEVEYNLIKSHSQCGYDILKSIEFPWPIAKIVLQHHERINGTGYPNSLRGDNIILEARILSVADVVEAMCFYRPYRPALGIDKALEEIKKNKGILYDPDIVDICIKIFVEKGFEFKEY